MAKAADATTGGPESLPRSSIVDRRTDVRDLASRIRPGATLGVGGSGLARKPVALLQRLARTGRDLTLVTLVGGLDVEILLGAGVLTKLVAAYVGLESLGLAPRFRAGREAGTLDFREWSEWTLLLALRAAAEGVPSTLTRAALGTDTEAENADWKRVACPFTGEPLLAVPAIRPDVALLHVSVADRLGNGWIEGDPHADAILAAASGQVMFTAEEVLPVDGRPKLGVPSVAGADAVAEVPHGAFPGGCAPRYRPDPDAINRMVTVDRQAVRS